MSIGDDWDSTFVYCDQLAVSFSSASRNNFFVVRFLVDYIGAFYVSCCIGCDTGLAYEHVIDAIWWTAT